MANIYTDFQNALAIALASGGGGSGADIVELTKEEYDALPDTKESDGKLYLINDKGIIIYNGIEYGGKGGSFEIEVVTKQMTTNAYGWLMDFTDSKGNLLKPSECFIYGKCDYNGNDYYTLMILPYNDGTGYLAKPVDTNKSAPVYIGGNASCTVTYYIIKKGTGSSQSSGVNYSTEEQVIGTWINGKPLYQKTIEKIFTSGQTGEIRIEHNIANIKNPIIVSGRVGDVSSPDRWFPINFNFPFSNGTVRYCWTYVANTYISCNISNDVNYDHFIFTIQYTKTTD